MGRKDSVSTQDNPPERKLSSGFTPENRLRTKSFGEKGTTHVMREYVGDEMDRQLAEKGMVKKAIARDNTSIFRAVCEQISSVQTDYQELRVLVEHMLTPIAQRHYKDTPSMMFERDKPIFEILADITNSRIIVHRASSEEPTVFEGTEVEDGREIRVCEGQYRGVYEPVYSNETHESLAISQSIVYRMLYEDVFQQPKEAIDEAIEYIRLDIDKHSHSTLDDLCMMGDGHMHSANAPCSVKPPKFPFCACKALDPAIYRNVEYDLYRQKGKENDQAIANSQAVKFREGARCLVRDGGAIRNAKVIAVSSGCGSTQRINAIRTVVRQDTRLVRFEDPPHITREFDVSDLRPPPTTAVTHHTMQSFVNRAAGGGGGGPQQMPFLPGCFPLPPPAMFAMPPPSPLSPMPVFMGGPPPHPPPPPQHWLHGPFSPPPPHMQAPPPPGHQMSHYPPHSAPSPMMFQPGGPPHFSFGSASSNDVMMATCGMVPPPPPPPTPMPMAAREQQSMGYSPAPVDSPSGNSSVFTATPLSSRKGADGKMMKNKKPRALSIDLADSPIAARPKKTEQRAHADCEQRRAGAGGGGAGGRRATEGDTVGEMNRPLQPKPQQQPQFVSTCSSLPENDSPAAGALPSMSMEQLPAQMHQQLQLNNAGGGGRVATAAAAYRAKLPSLLPLPPAQARGYYASSGEWTGDDTVFTADEGNTSQQSIISNHRDSPLVSCSSANDSQLQLGAVVNDEGGLKITIPFIKYDQFEAVNKAAAYSENPSGNDLPDMLSTRFFYNLGVQFFKNNMQQMSSEFEIRPPPPDMVPMPPVFMAPSPSLPPNSPAFFPVNGGPYHMIQTSAAPPNTPAIHMPTSLPPFLQQYYHPGVDGMPTYGYHPMGDGRGGGGNGVGQMMNQDGYHPMGDGRGGGGNGVGQMMDQDGYHTMGDGRGGGGNGVGQMMNQGPVTTMASPSSMVNQHGNFFFPPN